MGSLDAGLAGLFDYLLKDRETIKAQERDDKQWETRERLRARIGLDIDKEKAGLQEKRGDAYQTEDGTWLVPLYDGFGRQKGSAPATKAEEATATTAINNADITGQSADEGRWKAGHRDEDRKRAEEDRQLNRDNISQGMVDRRTNANASMLSARQRGGGLDGYANDKAPSSYDRLVAVVGAIGDITPEEEIKLVASGISVSPASILETTTAELQGTKSNIARINLVGDRLATLKKIAKILGRNITDRQDDTQLGFESEE